MPKKHIVKLTQEQHQQLVEIVKKGKATARMIRRAHTLLMAASGETSGSDRQNFTHKCANSGKDAQTVCPRKFEKYFKRA